MNWHLKMHYLLLLQCFCTACSLSETRCNRSQQFRLQCIPSTMLSVWAFCVLAWFALLSVFSSISLWTTSLSVCNHIIVLVHVETSWWAFANQSRKIFWQVRVIKSFLQSIGIKSLTESLRWRSFESALSNTSMFVPSKHVNHNIHFLTDNFIQATMCLLP